MKNTDIAKLFRRIKRLGLFTRSDTHEKVYEELIKNPDGEDDARFIATSGEPKEKRECSECRRMLDGDKFSYYQTRVNRQGELMRVNALCHECSDRINKERAEIPGKGKQNIPPKPKRGDVCPKCRRPWDGNWHQDHDYKTGEFRRWLCGQCNMAQHDRRTPDPE